MFYLVSAICHVACVVLLLTSPFEFRARRALKAARIQAEVKETPEAPALQAPRPVSLSARIGQSGTQADGDAPAEGDGQGGSAAGGIGDVPADLDTFAAAEGAEKAISAGLSWIARHQEPDGHWSFGGFGQHCQQERCSQLGESKADAAATGLALLPLIGAGQTQLSVGPYHDSIDRALRWLIDGQQANGDLSRSASGLTNDPRAADAPNAEGRMYAHAIATFAMSENFAMTRDRQIGVAAQLGVNFIAAAQNKATGGWSYEPNGYGNTSVVAWQMLALASAGRGGLRVDPACVARADKWLKAVAGGEHQGLFCYEPGRPVTATMTAIGLMCRQFEGLPAEHPALVEGRQYLLDHPPTSPFAQDVFYWYFSSAVMHRFGSSQWQVWFHALRRSLMESQVTTGCAAGSWSLSATAPEAWSARGGRLMITSFALQLLELEYGQLPVHAPLADTPVAATAEPNRR